jgi:hypothetical protein
MFHESNPYNFFFISLMPMKKAAREMFTAWVRVRNIAKSFFQAGNRSSGK